MEFQVNKSQKYAKKPQRKWQHVNVTAIQIFNNTNLTSRFKRKNECKLTDKSRISASISAEEKVLKSDNTTFSR